MKAKNSHSVWERLIATSGASLFLPFAILPTDIEFNTVASWYGPGFDGKKTASGEVYDQNKLTAANKELPFGTKLSVKNLTNRRTCVVVINDRGPYVHGRGIDLSREAAKRIGMHGTAPVYCCRVNQTKPTVIKPRIGIIQSENIASLTPVTQPPLNADNLPIPFAAPTAPSVMQSTTEFAAQSTAPSSTQLTTAFSTQSTTAFAVPSTIAVAAPSKVIPHRREILHITKRVHNFQYVAYLGAKRVQFDRVQAGNKFVKHYRA